MEEKYEIKLRCHECKEKKFEILVIKNKLYAKCLKCKTVTKLPTERQIERSVKKLK